MNSRKNSFKRVAAGALAVLTVAAYTAPVANVGGLPSAIIANAADETVDQYTLTWEAGIQDYITSISVGSTNINLAQVYGSARLTNIGDVTIVSKVPLDIGALPNYATLTEAQQKAAKPGEYYKVSGTTTLTYTLTLTKTNYEGIAANLFTGQKVKLSKYTTENPVGLQTTDERYNLKKDTEDFETAVGGEANVKIITTKTGAAGVAVNDATNGLGVANNVVKLTNVTISVDADLLPQDKTFEVLVYPDDATSTQNRGSAVATYDAKKQVYTATFQMFGEDASVGYRLKDAAKPNYDNTTDPTKLTASGGKFGSATDIAKITASASRDAEYDDLENVVVKAIDLEDGKFASKSNIDYGSSAQVTLNFTSDALNTISDFDRAGNEIGNIKLTVEKDGSTYQKIKDFYCNGILTKADVADATAKIRIDDGKIVTDGGTETAIENLTYVDNKCKLLASTEGQFNIYRTYVKSVNAGVTTYSVEESRELANGNLTFTEAGSYKVTATFFVADGNNALGKDLVFQFTINPYVVTAEDVAIQLYKDSAKTEVAENVTPKAIKFKNGKLEIEVPDEVAANTKYYVGLTVPSIILNEYNKQVDLYNAQVAAYNAGIAAAPGKNVGKKTAAALAHAKYVSQVANIPALSYTAADDSVHNLYAGKTKAELATYILNNIYTVEGDLDVQSLNDEKDATVVIKNQNYGATNAGTTTAGDPIIKNKNVDVTFELVRAAQSAKLTPKVDSEYEQNHILAIAKADATEENFEKLLWENFEGNEAAEANKGKFTFEYHEGTNWTKDNDDLDEREAGIPNTVSPDNYSVYVMLDDEVVEIVYVSIKQYKVKIVPTAASLAPTYGDKLDFSGYTLTNENGKKSSAKINGVKIKSIAKAALNSSGKPYKVDESYAVFGAANATAQQLNDGEGYLDAGKYIITFEEAEKDINADYAVSSDEFIIEVGKAALTADMFTVDAHKYNGTAQKVIDKDIHFKLNDDLSTDKATVNLAKYFQIADNTTRTAAGDYTVTIKAKADEAGSRATQYQPRFLNNYTGSVKVDWHIVASDVTATQGNAVGIKWDKDATTLVSNARIALKFTKNANPNLGNDNTGKAITVTKYGVILDKEGIIEPLDDTTYANQTWDGAIPANPNTATAVGKAQKAQNEAANRLQLGNGFTEGSSDNIDPALVKQNIYGTNVKVIDAETGIWLRPYALLSDGTVVYGNAVYRDLVHEATDKLQMKLNKATKLDGSKSGFGYDADVNKFLVYTSYKKLDASVTASVYHFGVVVDKKGVFDPYATELAGDATTNKLDALKATYEAAKADYEAKQAAREAGGPGAPTAQTVVNAKDAYDTAKAAYQNYKKVLDNLKLGNKHTEGNFDPKNTKLESNEYGANIKPVNTITGIWVRGYVDLGNGLVVYTEPQYIEDVSKQYLKGEFNGKLDVNIITKVGNNTQYDASFANPVPSNSDYEFVKCGVVVDKDEKFVRAAQTDVVAALKGDPYKKLILGKGFTEGKKTTAVATYHASVTPNTGKRIVARPYVTFKVNDTVGTITVYGEPELSPILGQ